MDDYIALENEETYILVTVLVEEFNLYVSKKITSVVDGNIDENNPKHIIFNLNKITYIDSSCIGYLITLRKKLAPVGREVVLVCKNEPVLTTLRIVKMDKFFKIFPGIEETVNFLNKI